MGIIEVVSMILSVFSILKFYAFSMEYLDSMLLYGRMLLGLLQSRCSTPH